MTMRQLMKDAERASKRKHFNPDDHEKPKRPWLDIDVGQSFEVGADEITERGLRSAGWKWSNVSGRVYAINKVLGGFKVTRTE